MSELNVIKAHMEQLEGFLDAAREMEDENWSQKQAIAYLKDVPAVPEDQAFYWYDKGHRKAIQQRADFGVPPAVAVAARRRRPAARRLCNTIDPIVVTDRGLLKAMGMRLDADTHYVVSSAHVPLYSVFYYDSAFYEFCFVSGAFHPRVEMLSPKLQLQWENRYVCYQLFNAGERFNPANSKKAYRDNLEAGQRLSTFRFHPKSLFYFK